MRTTMLFLAMCVYSTTMAQYNKENLKVMKAPRYHQESVESTDHYDVTFTYKNLRLFPIIANDAFVHEHKDIGKFTPLKKAIEEKKIVITETGATHLADTAQDNVEIIEPVEPIIELQQSSNSNIDIQQQQVQNIQLASPGSVSGTVNTLFAKNTSSDTIFIMAGEVVKGGKQDRVIGQDVVLVPGQEINLSAFCVEKSRWTTKDGNQGKFTGYYNVTSMDIRKTVTKEKSQTHVWEKVDKTTQANSAFTSTKTYTALENSEEYQQKLKAYLEKFENAFKDETKVIGVVAVTGDKVMGCDLFATHDLFNDAYSSLIHSYITEAITNGKEVSLSNDKVGEYLDRLLADESKQSEEIDRNGSMYEHGKKKLHITTF